MTTDEKVQELALRAIPPSIALVGGPDGAAHQHDTHKTKRDRFEREVRQLIEDEKRELLERLSLAVIEPCEPDCDPERHARHEGTWQAHLVIEQELNNLQGESHE